ncbi:hypothetical protein D0C36_21810 [Mucilaginibacter conchicola]|uniref:Outer membrane protein beta-barrel domain-containing protein n=1 Tax=Mucilaginibacter conchicola TaxID=2303333 RepID=A0A372NP58_9SPHI|nr:hypothetical protein [Mucilaginibacter conchicola]RFZ90430.1 hypothetical protein D0C36_21810 [Mucilaginibacter conchicola]
MIKLFLKSTLFTLLLSAITVVSKAQIGYDYAQYDLGLGGAFNTVYGDAESLKSTPSIAVSFNYNQTPYANYIFELQSGNLEGGSITSATGRYFKNSYTALVFRGQLQAGEIMDYSGGGIMGGLKNLYLSTGVGYVLNDMKKINRESYVLEYNDGTPFYTGGLNKSNELYIPARIGYEFKFFNQYNQPSFKLDIGYQLNFDLTDNLDGFTAGKNKDVWSQISINLKFALGGVTSYRKTL